MKVQIVRTHSLQAVSAQGPITRVFNVGDVVDLDELQANIFIAQQVAVLASDKQVKIVDVEKPSKVSKAKR